MRQYQAVLFDLDGTLLNTLEDLADSVNAILRKHSFPERTYSEIRSFLGNGAEALMRASLPDGVAEEDFLPILSEYKAYYKSHMEDKTKPYDGIPELLEALHASGIKIAVASNKFYTAVQGLCAKYFPGHTDIAIGECQTDGLLIRRKPAPDMLSMAAEQLGVPFAACVYIGDSEVDIETAKNAGIDCISVSWGFRDVETLQKAGASAIADSPQALAKMLLSETAAPN